MSREKNRNMYTDEVVVTAMQNIFIHCMFGDLSPVVSKGCDSYIDYTIYQIIDNRIEELDGGEFEYASKEKNYKTILDAVNDVVDFADVGSNGDFANEITWEPIFESFEDLERYVKKTTDMKQIEEDCQWNVDLHFSKYHVFADNLIPYLYNEYYLKARSPMYDHLYTIDRFNGTVILQSDTPVTATYLYQIDADNLKKINYEIAVMERFVANGKKIPDGNIDYEKFPEIVIVPVYQQIKEKENYSSNQKRTIYWHGRSTNGIWKREAEADSFMELYQKCIDNDTISRYDEDPWEKAILEKYHKTWDDFNDEDGELDYEKFHKWCEKEDVSLTDKELYFLIGNEKGNAYYQTFEVLDNGKYREIDRDDFDENENFKTVDAMTETYVSNVKQKKRVL